MNGVNPFKDEPEVEDKADVVVFMNQILEPYIKSAQVWVCPSRDKGWVNVDKTGGPADPLFRSYGGQNSYSYSNYTFKSGGGIALASMPAPAETVGMVDGTYYNTLPQNPCQLKGQGFIPTGDYLYYWKQIGNSSYTFGSKGATPPDATAIEKGKARHLGTINTLFMDGHAKAIQYDKIISGEGLTVGGTTNMWDPYKQGC